jgi:hypothetical protein
MKKLLIVLSLAMAAFSFQAGAATVGLVNGHGSFSASHDTAFEDTWTFTIPLQGNVSAAAINIADNLAGLIEKFSASLDGSNLSYKLEDTTQTLIGKILGSAAGSSHTLIISGASQGSYGGSIDTTRPPAIGQTPIPAAIWLFGSALIGLTGATRRKTAKA